MASTREAGPRIDAGFPGGNIIVDRIVGNEVFVRQDLRDTEGWWFYWVCRIRGARGLDLVFHFENRDVLTRQGPCFSADGGTSWNWLGRDRVVSTQQGVSFPFHVPADEVLLSFAIPYTQADLGVFLKNIGSTVSVDQLCRSRKGRPVERLTIDARDTPVMRLLLTARHHACEMIANYVMEGILQAALEPGPAADRRFWDRVQITAIPFVDKDGVEDGDQGKNRRPRDHNRDYAGDCIYPETAAVRDLVARWPCDPPVITMDLHCPCLTGTHNEHAYVVGSEDIQNAAKQREFVRLLAGSEHGPWPFSDEDHLAFGTSWNTAGNYGQGMSCGRWMCGRPSVALALSFEIPYGNVRGVAVTRENARAFGRGIARALHAGAADLCR